LQAKKQADKRFYTRVLRQTVNMVRFINNI
jgi:hypothetical protein